MGISNKVLDETPLKEALERCLAENRMIYANPRILLSVYEDRDRQAAEIDSLTTLLKRTSKQLSDTTKLLSVATDEALAGRAVIAAQGERIIRARPYMQFLYQLNPRPYSHDDACEIIAWLAVNDTQEVGE